MHKFYSRTFSELSNTELYRLLVLRQQVFILEQSCLYPDLDGKDLNALHILGYGSPSDDTEELVAYSRILSPGVRFEEVSIGRVVTAQGQRKKSVGRELMRFSLSQCESLFPQQSIRISAQAHLEAFYAEFGFDVASSLYDEDGIPHIEMLRSSSLGSRARY